MFHTLFYEPIYNLLVVILTIVPTHDVAISIIIVTLIIKLLLLPLNLSALRTQYAMKRLEPQFNKIKELQKTNPQESSKMMIELYKKEKVNPFSSLFAVLLQIPIFLALYFAFSEGLQADADSLYSFAKFPETLHTLAFGLFDVTLKGNIVIALLTGFSSYALARRQTMDMTPKKDEKNVSGEISFQEQFMKSMKIQLLYVLPIIIAVSAYALPAALGLYWFVSNIIGYIQDVYMKNVSAHLHPDNHKKHHSK